MASAGSYFVLAHLILNVHDDSVVVDLPLRCLRSQWLFGGSGYCDSWDYYGVTNLRCLPGCCYGVVKYQLEMK